MTPKLMLAECIHCKRTAKVILYQPMFKAKCPECGAPVVLVKKIKDLVPQVPKSNIIVER